MLRGLPFNEPMPTRPLQQSCGATGAPDMQYGGSSLPHTDMSNVFDTYRGAALMSIPSQKGQHSPGILTGYWQLCLQAMAVQCGSPSTHWQKVQSSSFHCSSWARSLLFTQQLALVLSIGNSSTSERRHGHIAGCKTK